MSKKKVEFDISYPKSVDVRPRSVCDRVAKFLDASKFGALWSSVALAEAIGAGVSTMMNGRVARSLPGYWANGLVETNIGIRRGYLWGSKETIKAYNEQIRTDNNS